MSEWKECKLGEICSDISYGYTESASLAPIGPKFLRITDIVPGRVDWETVPYCDISSENRIKYQLLNGDIVVARTGATTGYNYTIKPADMKHDSVFASYLIRYRVDTKIAEPFFIGHLLTSTMWQGFVEGILSGSAQPGANAKQFADFEILLPPLPEQHAIAGVLSSLDDKIDLLHRQNKTLEGMAAALWQKMFVEEAKTEWEIIPFGKLVELQRGISYQGNQLATDGNGTPMHNLNSIDIKGSYKYEGIKFYAGEIKGKQKLRSGDLLIINTDITQNNRIIGWPIFVPDSFAESTFTHHLYSVTLQSDRISKLYLFFLLRHRDYRERLASSANGTTVSMLSKEAIYNLEISIPPVHKRKEFEGTASVILDKQSLNHNQIKILTQSRDNLLPKLMSGEVKVKV